VPVAESSGNGVFLQLRYSRYKYCDEVVLDITSEMVQSKENVVVAYFKFLFMNTYGMSRIGLQVWQSTEVP
jgi:hypothetical protein